MPLISPRLRGAARAFGMNRTQWVCTYEIDLLSSVVAMMAASVPNRNYALTAEMSAVAGKPDKLTLARSAVSRSIWKSRISSLPHFWYKIALCLAGAKDAKKLGQACRASAHPLIDAIGTNAKC